MNEKQLLHEYINSILEANKLTEEVTYRTVDFNKLLEIDPDLEYELESRSESNDYRLIYKRFLRSKTGKLRLDYNQLDLIAYIYEDDSKHDHICEILYGPSINEMVYGDDVTPFELSNNPVKFTVYGDSNNRSEYDFNNLKELFKYVSDCGGFNSFTGLRWYISSNYKDGEFYYIRDRFSKGGWRWEDCNGNPVQGTEYRKSRKLSEDEVSDKYNIFQQIKIINPNAKYSNYKNKSVNEMLAILQSYRDSQNKSKKQKVSPKVNIPKKQIGLIHLNNNNFEVLFSDGTSEKMNYETAKSRGYLDYQDLNDKDREEYDLNHMNESSNLTEATITDIINDSKSSDPRRIALAKSLYTEYKGVDSDGTLLFETDSQTRSALGHKQFIFYPGFFDMLDKVDQNEAITEEDVLNILTGDLSLKCTCESFLYFSWAYKSWKNDYGLQKETRAPKRNNVNLNGGACKHCLSVLELINRSNTLFDKIAKDLNTLFQHYKKQDITQKEIERLQNELKNMKAPDLKSQANNNNITGTNN